MARVGFGYDIHAFAAGRSLVLGGVAFPGELGLAGHSDADVLLHAVADALLGAAALGDIGDHFSPNDPQWHGVASSLIVEHVLAMIPTHLRLSNLDTTIIAERPRIGPLREAIRQSLADLLAIGIDQVSVKATTNEGLGALGRGEGIAAMAVVLLEEA
jgi:2-C-methyl-D-erythritol 2,4-cyclodiphosphate synthase